ncbi:helix-turn-helix domain-containing protein [Nonomuraea guangzhouensis]|uniref:Helix-turn-helix domain-containing protein n=1 Tax=Nonomuraea guangzhouensis TaxID=1291555 RepID=A0ABW4H0I5_9ACTN|nr:helix-turn-helix transcriptional regulator [Nonomuraea guangzhouensis]
MMSARGTEPRNQREYLGAELRKLRERAGLSGREVAAHLEIAQTSVSRIERGLKVPTQDEITKWAALTGAAPDVQTRMGQLAEAAYTEVATWRTALRDGTHLQDRIGNLEEQARVLRHFETIVVPGLLQTPEYARRVIQLADVTGTQDHEAALARRLQRQDVLYDSDRRFEFLITEGALRARPPGPPAILVAQMGRISSLADMDNVTIGLLPFDRVIREAIGWSEFAIYEGADDEESVAFAEVTHAELTISDPRDVQIYTDVLNRLARVAIYGDEARDLLNRIARETRAAGQ